ncbi:right-handed parallel beta-helix repeat-containing protein [Luteimonas aestuarii]|nr:right-handed parallel beta-helix repeat-containing protein [Luteimonas aestuarii]
MPVVPLRRPGALFAGLVLSCALPASAAELFVATNGNDSSGNGSSSNPYRTVKRAISAGTTGDTITIRAGTYNECDVRLRQRMTLRSPSGQRARIHCDINTSNTVTVQIDPGASGSRLSNLEISGGFFYGVMLQTNWYQGGPASNTGASDVVLEDLLVHGTGRDGIKITPKSNRAIIRRVEIHSTGQRDSGNADGIDNVNGDGMLVEDSYIHDTATTGLYFKGGARNVIVQRNRIENTGNAGILVGFDTSPEFFDLTVNPQYYEAIGGIVRNNVIRNTAHTGIGLYSSRDAVVANNTIVNAAQSAHSAIMFGIVFQGYGSHAGRPPNLNPRIQNNLVIQNNNRCIEVRYSTELGGLSALSGSPGTDWNGYSNGCTFRDSRPNSGISGAGTLAQWRAARGTDANSKQAAYTVSASGHLPANSPAINAGTTVAEVTDDIDRQARVAPYDIGADEYMAASPPVRATGAQPLLPGTVSAAGQAVAAGQVAQVVPVAASAGTSSTSPATATAGAGGGASAVRIRPPILRAWLWLRDRIAGASLLR